MRRYHGRQLRRKHRRGRSQLRCSQRIRTFETLEKRVVLDGMAIVGQAFQDDVSTLFEGGSAQQYSADANVLQLQELATGLQSPRQILSADDGSGRVFVVEQTGQVRILRHGDAGPDVVPPLITDVFPTVTDSDAIITWTSDELTTGYVEYGPTTELGFVSTTDTKLSDDHRSALLGLDAQTQYYFRVIASDASGNTTESQLFSLVSDSVPVAGEVLYNGIVLPSQWPPATSETQVPQVAPYLVSPPDVIDIDVGRQLFVDDFLIAETTLSRSPHRPQFFDGNPILSPGDVHDFNRLAMVDSGGVVYDPDDGLFKIWYTGSQGNLLSYAYSSDGMNWIKPSFPDSAAFPNSNTVLQIGSGFSSTTVRLDPLAQDANKKFVLFAYTPPRKLGIWYSPDGINWTKDTNSVPALADRTTMFYNPFRDVWVSSLRSHSVLPAAGGREAYTSRTRSYAESTDLSSFTPMQFWTGPDLRDPVYYEPYGESPELYNLDAIAYESVMVGMFTWWNPGAPYPGYESPGPRLNELGVGFSRDGFHWERPTRGAGDEAFIPASNVADTWNGYNTQSAAGNFAVVGDELWFYFAGRSQKKPFFGDTSTGMAKLRRDGFYSMDAGATEGTLTTRPLEFSGQHLFVNVDNPTGQLQVEVLDLDGNVIAPFSKANSIPVSGDKTLVEVQWSGVADLSALSGTPVRFRFHLTDGELYSFWVSDSATGASNGYMAAGGPGLTGPTDTVGTSGYSPSDDATNEQNERIVTPVTTLPAHVQPEPFLDISGLVELGYGRGIQSIAFHPHFDSVGDPGEGKLYVYYNAPATMGGDHDLVVSEFRVSASDADLVDVSSERVLLRLNQPEFNGNGGAGGDGFPVDDSEIARKGGGLSFGPDDGLLYVATDGGYTGEAHELSSLLGKVLRIDVDGNDSANGQYGIPATNPFFNDAGAMKEIYALGFNRPGHLSFDDGSNGLASADRLFVTDVGYSGWEEVNLIVPGGNYGWDFPLGGAELIDPIARYTKSGYGESVVGGNVYSGTGLPRLDGRYLMGDTIGQLKSLSQDGATWHLQTNSTLGDSLTAVSSIADNVYLSTPNTLYQVSAQTTSLPTWLSFDPTTGLLSGTPDPGDIGTIQLQITATDALGSTVTKNFELTVASAAATTVTVAATQSASEPGSNGEFTITRTGDAIWPLTVQFSVGGTAVAGSDYEPLVNHVTLPLGQFTATVPLTVIDDAEAEFDETVIITLAPDDAYQLSADPTATLTIASDEQIPLIDIQATIGAASEPDQEGQLVISRTGSTAQPLTVFFDVTGTALAGTDFDSIGTSVVIPSTSSSVTLPIAVRNDSLVEGVETVVVTLRDHASYGLAASTAASVSIIDDDGPSITRQLQAHWTLDEGTGVTAADQSGRGNVGTLQGGPLWSNARVNGGLQFDGIDDSVDVGTGAAIIGSAPFSVASWIRTTASQDQVIVQQRSEQGFNGAYMLQLQPSGHAHFWTFGDMAQGPSVASTQVLNDDQWHHLVGVREVDGTMRLYVDGVLDSTAPGPIRPLIELSVHLGADKRNHSRFFAGKLDDVRIYSRALSPDEVETLSTLVGSGLTAVDDSFSSDENEPISMVGPGLLQNDRGDAIAVSAIDSISAQGVPVSGGVDGGFQYDPGNRFDHLAVGESLVDTFHYSISDSSNTESATVTITILGVNDPPSATADTTSTYEDEPVNVVVLQGDSDVDSDVINVSSVDDSATIGSVTLNGDQTVTYSPNGRFNDLDQGESATDTFEYTIIDDQGATSTALVTIVIHGRINIAAADDTATTDEDSSVSIDILANDTGGGAPPQKTITNIDLTATVGLAFLNPDNTISYDPNGKFDHLAANEIANDAFSYTITDASGDSETATVSLSIHGVNDQPIAVDDSASTDELSAITIEALNGDSDPDLSDQLTVISVDTTSTLGAVVLAGDGTITYNPDGQFDSLEAGQSATDSFAYTISDGNGGLATALVQVTIFGLTSATEPTEGLLAHWTLDDGAGTIAVDATVNGHDALISGNPVWSPSDRNGRLDFDGAGDSLNAGLGPAIVGKGGFTVAAWVKSSATSNQVIVQQRSPQQFNGEYQLHLTSAGYLRFWTFGDSAYGPFVVSSQKVNDGLWHHVVGVREDDGTTKVYIDGSLNGSRTGTPRSMAPITVYVGADMRGATGYLRGSLDDVRIYDRALDADEIDGLYQYVPSSTAAIIATDDSYIVDESLTLTVAAPGLLQNDSGVNVVVTRIDASSALGGSITGGTDGAFHYVPATSMDHLAVGESVSDTFTYTISDTVDERVGTVTVTIAGVNDVPVAMDDTGSTDQDTAITINVLANDTDVDATDMLTVAAIDDEATIGHVTLNFDGTITYDPQSSFQSLAANDSATDTFRYTATDGKGGSSTGIVTVTVTGLNDLPIARADWAATNEQVAIPIAVLSNDTDADSGSVLIIDHVDTTGTLGIVTLGVNGIQYDPNGAFESLSFGQIATDTFSYTIKDSDGGTATAVVTISISGVNDQPVAADDVVTTDEDNLVTINVLPNDSDIDQADTLSVESVHSDGTIGNVSIHANGSISYDPAGRFESLAAGESATDQFSYTVSDSQGGSDTATVTVTITGKDESSLPTEGLVAHWTFDENSGTVANDESGNGHVASIGGNPQWSNGQLGSALEFDGAGDHLNAGLAPSIVGTGGFSVGAWVRSSAASHQVIIQQRSPQQYNGEYQLQLLPSGHVRFWTFGGFSYGPIVASSQKINDGQWHHVLGVRAADGSTKIYIDGEVDGSKTGTPRPLQPITVYIGADMRGGHHYFKGTLDDVRIYNRELSSEEIQALSSVTSQAPGDGLVLLSQATHSAKSVLGDTCTPPAVEQPSLGADEMLTDLAFSTAILPDKNRNMLPFDRLNTSSTDMALVDEQLLNELADGRHDVKLLSKKR